ncbi:MAG: nickel-dependent lactate racemase [Bryobacteraceae bacterium]
MNVNLAFGKTGLPLQLPDGFRYRVLEARSATALADAAAAIERALDQPIGRPPLEEMARGKRSAAISVCDITRPVPNGLILPPMLTRLERAGIPRENIIILIATGLHRGATGAEIREIVTPAIAANYRVENHDARVLASHRPLGNTSSGTPVYIDERFLAADLHITVGLIEPHLMLGFSGGRKLIAPGLAAQETIKTIHSPYFMRMPEAIEGVTEENPLHAELLEVARMARHDFMCDVALTQDRRVGGVFAGDPVEAHRRGVQLVSRALLEQLDQPVDGVITTSAGYPLDLTFYQAIKGVTAAQHVVKPGGRILLIAECAEGAGAPEFKDMLRGLGSYQQFLDRIAHGPVTVDQWQIEKLALVGTRVEIFYYVPGLPREYQEAFGPNTFATVEAALAAFTDGLPANANVAVIPEGPYVLARAAAA